MKKKKENVPLTTQQQTLVATHLSYAAKLSKRYVTIGLKKGVAAQDLQQEAYLGLCIAALYYDTKQGVTFATFAYTYCRKQMEIALKKQAETPSDDDDMAMLRDMPEPEELTAEEHTSLVEQLLSHLNSQEQRVIRMLFGIACGKMTFKATGETLKLSASRIHEIYDKAMTKLERLSRKFGVRR